jgi:hypothetical protein
MMRNHLTAIAGRKICVRICVLKGFVMGAEMNNFVERVMRSAWVDRTLFRLYREVKQMNGGGLHSPEAYGFGVSNLAKERAISCLAHGAFPQGVCKLVWSKGTLEDFVCGRKHGHTLTVRLGLSRTCQFRFGL